MRMAVPALALVAAVTGCAAESEAVTPIPEASALEATPVVTPAPPSAAPATPDPTPVPTPEPEPSFTLATYPVPAGSRPHDVAPAEDGGVWFTAQGTGHLG